MTSEDGDTFMLKAGPTHEIVRTNSVDEPVYSSAAHLKRADLHPGGETSVRDREVTRAHFSTAQQALIADSSG